MGVLVIGMHRSGTSALTGALEAAGLFLGPPSAVAPTERDNPEGYFELYPVAKLNDEILAHLGGAWDRPPALPERWFADPGVEGFVHRASDVVASSFRGRQFVLKDPRMTLILPLWRRALLDHCCAIVIVRDPVAVAWSLALRNGLSNLTSLALWSRYYRSAIEGLAGLPVHVCRYEELVEDPAKVLTAITTSLRDWGELCEEVDLDAAIARIKPVLRRDTWPQSQMEMASPPREVAALAKLLVEGMGRHDSFELGSIPEPGCWEHALLEERRIAGVQLRESGLELIRIRAQSADSQQRCERAEQELLAQRERFSELEHELDPLRERLLASGMELTRIQAQDADLQRRCERAETENADLKRTVEALSRYDELWNRLQRLLPSRIYRAVRNRFRI
jgi:hypothetical protein